MTALCLNLTPKGAFWYETSHRWLRQHGQTPRPAGKGIDAAIQIVGVDTAEGRRAEAKQLALADEAYPSIAEAVAAAHPDAALVCTAPLSHAAVIGELLDNGLPVFT